MSTVLGSVDSSRIDYHAPVLNWCYIFPGSNNTSGSPSYTGAVLQAANDCTFSYSITGVANGDYTVAITKNGGASFVTQANLTVNGDEVQNFAAATVITVGPSGRDYTHPNDVVASNGAVIAIDAGLYTGVERVWTHNDLTFRGVGGLARMQAPGTISNEKGIWVTQGSNNVIERCEGFGASVPDENGAFVRAEGNHIALSYCIAHDNENGFLGGAGNVLVDNVELYLNGFGDGQSHNIYIGFAARFIMRFCYSHHCNWGQIVKSNAEENHVLYSRLTDEVTGEGSYQIDFPHGGLCFVIGTSMQKGPESTNSGAMISFGAEGFTLARKKLYVVNCTGVNQLGDNLVAFIKNYSGGDPVTVTNFRTVGNSDPLVDGAWTDGGGNIDTPAANSRFEGYGGYDYRLTPDDPGVDAGVDPGTGDGYDLTPTHHFNYLNRSEARPAYAPIDSGAFEFGNPVPSWVAAMDLFEWYEIPNTDLASVDPSPVPDGVEGPSAKVNDWTSFVADRRDSKVYSADSGGHAGYSGNEVDRLVLETENPFWEAMRPPTTNANLLNATHYSDGRPTSRHQYYGCTVDEWNDRVMLFSGSKWSDGDDLITVDSWNIGTPDLPSSLGEIGDYNAAGTHPNIPEPIATQIQGNNIILCTLDPSTGDVYVASGGHIDSTASKRWIRSSNTWSASLSGTAPIGGSMSAFDTSRNRLLLVSPSEQKTYTVGGSWANVTIGGANANDVKVWGGALFYVPALDRYIMRPEGSGGAIYQIHPTTFAATTFSTSGGGSIPAVTNGVYNKCLSVPRLGGALLYPAYGGNAWFLKLFDAAAQISGEPPSAPTLMGQGMI